MSIVAEVEIKPEGLGETEETPAKIINISKHFSQRWAERILEIGKDAPTVPEKLRQAKEYAAQNFEMIKAHANKTFMYAEFVWRGQLGDNVTRNYYIEDDIIFVLNTTNDAMITAWKVDFGLPGKGNTEARKSLVEEIHRLVAEKDEIEFKILEQQEAKQQEMIQLDETIAILQSQLKNAQERKTFATQEMKEIQKETLHIALETKKYTNMLINSKEYQADLGVM